MGASYDTICGYVEATCFRVIKFQGWIWYKLFLKVLEPRNFWGPSVCIRSLHEGFQRAPLWRNKHLNRQETRNLLIAMGRLNVSILLSTIFLIRWRSSVNWKVQKWLLLLLKVQAFKLRHWRFTSLQKIFVRWLVETYARYYVDRRRRKEDYQTQRSRQIELDVCCYTQTILTS